MSSRPSKACSPVACLLAQKQQPASKQQSGPETNSRMGWAGLSSASQRVSSSSTSPLPQQWDAKEERDLGIGLITARVCCPCCCWGSGGPDLVAMQSFQSQRWRRRTTAAGGFGFDFDLDSLKRLGHISPAVQSHLKHVYLTLCSALAFSALGAYLHVLLNVGGTLTTVGCLAAIAFLISLPPSQDQERNRFALLMSAALLQGASVGPLVDLVLDFDPRILVTAFVGTAIAFGCFSGAAIIAKRREYLYLGGLLSSALSILLWLQFAASIFGHSSATFFTFELYFGLLVFLGYMVFDTQEIIERAHHGDMDYIKHALTLFTDFVAVLVRVLVIMLRNAQEKSEEDKKRKKRY